LIYLFIFGKYVLAGKERKKQPQLPHPVVVLDNGGGLIKAGLGGEHDPFAVLC
jgi:actin-related protein